MLRRLVAVNIDDGCYIPRLSVLITLQHVFKESAFGTLCIS